MASQFYCHVDFVVSTETGKSQVEHVSEMQSRPTATHHRQQPSKELNFHTGVRTGQPAINIAVCTRRTTTTTTTTSTQICRFDARQITLIYLWLPVILVLQVITILSCVLYLALEINCLTIWLV